jgi:hypothetical protein
MLWYSYICKVVFLTNKLFSILIEYSMHFYPVALGCNTSLPSHFWKGAVTKMGRVEKEVLMFI